VPAAEEREGLGHCPTNRRATGQKLLSISRSISLSLSLSLDLHPVVSKQALLTARKRMPIPVPLLAACWLLAAGCWLLAAGCWLLAAGCWLLAACGFLLAVVPMIAVGCSGVPLHTSAAAGRPLPSLKLPPLEQFSQAEVEAKNGTISMLAAKLSALEQELTEIKASVVIDNM
jgi:hypothetical protein